MTNIQHAHQDETVKTQRGPLWIPFLLFVWPFIYLFRYIVPIKGQYIPIGNDFSGLYYPYKIYLLAHLSHGQIPLWSPSEAAGFPLFSNPFAQVYYPLNLLLIPWYRIMGGYSILDYQVYTVLGISIFALGLYCWLRLMHSNIRSIVFAVLVMTVSFKMTELLRFSNAVHTAAWYPWILYTITRIFSSKSTKDSLVFGSLMIFFVYCLATAGYPYLVYYTLFLFIPYVGLFFIRKLRRSMFDIEQVPWKRSVLTLLCSGILSVVAVFPYLLSIKKMMSETVDRSGDSFSYSTSYHFNIQDTIGSLVYPPFAQWEGWYFFSLTALLIICLFVFRCFQKGSDLSDIKEIENKAVASRRRWFCLTLLVWMLIISYISWGRESYLFKLLWHYMPGFSSLRVWGRLNVILVPLLAWLLCWAYSDFEIFVFAKQEKVKAVFRSTKLPWLLTIGAVYFIIFQAQYYLHKNNMTDSYWQRFGLHCDEYRVLFLIVGAIAFVAIFLFLLLGSKMAKWIKHAPLMMFFVLLIIAIAEMWPIGSNSWVAPKQDAPSRVQLSFESIMAESFTTKRKFQKKTISQNSTYYTGIIPNWYFERYVHFLRKHGNEQSQVAYLLGLMHPQKVFFSEQIDHATVHSYLVDSTRFKQPGELISYNGDILVWEIEASRLGYLSFIDNWDPYWKVTVDGKEEKLERLFGTFKSVHLEKGKHRVEFRYEPSLRSILMGPRK